MANGRLWSETENEYLRDNWGCKSIGAIAKALGRSEHGIRCRVSSMRLGPFFKEGEYVSLFKISKTVRGRGIYKNKGVFISIPKVRKKVQKRSFYVVSLYDFWEWAEENQHLLDFSRFEENTMGIEPKWAKEKRTRDYKRSLSVKRGPWTPDEDTRLIQYLKQYKYSCKELAKMMCKTEGAILSRIHHLKLKERPIIAGKYGDWNSEKIDMLISMIREGYDYWTIALNLPDKSETAIRGKIYRLFKISNLDKVREMILNGYTVGTANGAGKQKRA